MKSYLMCLFLFGSFFTTLVGAPTPAPLPTPTTALTSRQQREAQEIAEALIKRDGLLEEVGQLTNSIGERKNQIAERINLETRIADKKKNLEELKKNPQDNAVKIIDEETEIQALETAVNAMPKAENLTGEITALEHDIKRKNSQISLLLGTLTGQYSGEQSFRQHNSITFAILIGLVIVGFFSLAFLDTHVRTAIFGGESGIQFVALFSIIIAIILFGISGILEGKELSALLGGLSGYILGRTSSSRSPNSPGQNVGGGGQGGGGQSGGEQSGGGSSSST